MNDKPDGFKIEGLIYAGADDLLPIVKKMLPPLSEDEINHFLCLYLAACYAKRVVQGELVQRTIDTPIGQHYPDRVLKVAKLIDPEAWHALVDGRDKQPGALWHIRRAHAETVAKKILDVLCQP